jgi:hypothetical protein
MAARSIFQAFIITLREKWRTELPTVQPLKKSFGTMMPKASTFFAGVSPRLRKHVFLNFQHSSKSWEAGRFTVNVILSEKEGPPETSGGPFAPDKGRPFTEGSYRISSVLGRPQDKWWHLKADGPAIVTEAWRPTSYDDRDAVLAEAVADVTIDVRKTLRKFGINDSSVSR